MTAAVIFSGGINHPFEHSAPALASVLEQVGMQPLLTFELEAACAALKADPTALFVLHALRWSMTQHEKYIPDRPQWAMSIPDAARATIRSHIERGAGLVGLHTASICFDTWPEWPAILGGGWQWGRSFHPPPAPLRVRLSPTHPLTRGLPDFTVVDELYSEQSVGATSDVCGWLDPIEPMPDIGKPLTTQPALWTQEYGAGRVVYGALGHDAASILHPVHRRLLQRAALWACGKPQSIVEAA
jgi:hypothetical protein